MGAFVGNDSSSTRSVANRVYPAPEQGYGFGSTSRRCSPTPIPGLYTYPAGITCQSTSLNTTGITSPCTLAHQARRPRPAKTNRARPRQRRLGHRSHKRFRSWLRPAATNRARPRQRGACHRPHRPPRPRPCSGKPSQSQRASTHKEPRVGLRAGRSF